MRRFFCFIITIVIIMLLCSCNIQIAKVDNIFLSSDNLNMGIGETVTLIATVSPGNIKANLTWSSSNPAIADVNESGTVTAKSEGNVVIKVQANNGVLAVCNVNVKMKTGSVTGEVTYKYNNFIGHRADTGTEVILISKNITSMSYEYFVDLPDGCYKTEVSGSGNYSFDNIPVGEYYLVMISNHTNEGYASSYSCWGGVYNLFSKEDQEDAMLTAKVHKTRTTEIVVKENKETIYSYDFGLTAYVLG